MSGCLRGGGGGEPNIAATNKDVFILFIVIPNYQNVFDKITRCFLCTEEQQFAVCTIS